MKQRTQNSSYFITALAKRLNWICLSLVLLFLSSPSGYAWEQAEELVGFRVIFSNNLTSDDPYYDIGYSESRDVNYEIQLADLTKTQYYMHPTATITLDDLFANLVPGVPYTLTLSGNDVDSANVYFYLPEGYRMLIDGEVINYIHFGNWEQTDRSTWMDPGEGPVIIDDKTAQIMLEIPDEIFAPGAPAGTDLGLQVGKFDWKVALGNLPNGRSAGSIAIKSNGLPSSTFDIDSLIYQTNITSSLVDVIRTGAGDDAPLRQIKAPQALADITSTTNGYTISFYAPDDVGTKSGGVYPLVGTPTPFIKYTIEPDINEPGDDFILTRVEDQDGSDQSSRTTITKAYYSAGDWQLIEHGNGSVMDAFATTSGSDTINTVNIGPLLGSPVSTTKAWEKAYAWGGEIFKTEATIDGNTYTTLYDYHTNSGVKGDYTHLKSVEYPNGSWVYYDYNDSNDFRGYLSKKYQSHLDSKDGQGNPIDADDVIADESLGVVTNYTYTNLWLGAIPMVSKIETKVLGNLTNKVEYSYDYGLPTYTHNSKDVLLTTIKNYSNATNYQETVTASYRYDENPFYAKKPIYTKSPNGAMTYHEIPTEAGSGGEWVEKTYVGAATNSGGDYLYYTTAWGQTFYLIPNKSTRIDTVRDSRGFVLRTETFVHTGSGSFTEVASTEYEYEDAGYVKKVTGSNNTVAETTWTDGRATSIKAPDGTTMSYLYDDLGNVTRQTRAATTVGVEGYATPQLVTDFQYDEASRLTRQIVGPIGEPNRILTEWKYHQTGNLDEVIAPGGYTTGYTYAADDLSTTETLPGGATIVRSTYKNGWTKSITGTAVSAEQHFTYGVESDGRSWTKVAIGSAGSPRWQKTWRDWQGKVLKTETPASGSHSNLVVTNTYDSTKGQLLSQSSSALSAVTRYTYNSYGELTHSWLDVNNDSIMGTGTTDRIQRYVTTYDQEGSDWGVRQQVFTYGVNADGSPSSTEKEIANTFTYLTGLTTGTSPTRKQTSRTLSYGIEGSDNTVEEVVEIYPDSKRTVVKSLFPDGSGSNSSTMGNGVLIEEQSSAGVTQSYEYDAYGRLEKANDRTGVHVMAYVAGTSLISVANATGSSSGDANQQIYTYNTAGHIEKVQSAKTADPTIYSNTYFAYDTKGRITHRWGDGVMPIRYTYDTTYGHLKQQDTYRSGSAWSADIWPAFPGIADTTEWTVEAKTGLLLLTKDAANESVAYEYNAFGALSKRTWARGDVTNYQYDSQTGELTKIDYPSAADDVDITYSYTRLGQLKTVNDATGQRSFTFDANTYATVTETLPSAFFGTNAKIDYGYASTVGSGLYKGKLTSIEYLNNSTSRFKSSYTYEAASGRLDKIKYGSDTTDFDYSYLSNSDLVSSLDYGTNYATDLVWGSNDNAMTSVETSWGATSIAKHTYVYDLAYRKTKTTQTGSIYGGYGTVNGLETDYTYDLRNQLLTATTVLGGTSTQLADRSVTFTYDIAGNRATSKEGASTPSDSYTTTSLNQYDTRTVSADRYVRGFANSTAAVLVDGNATTRQGDYFYKDISKGSNYSVNVKASQAGAGPGGIDLFSEVTLENVIPTTFGYDLDGNMTSDGEWTYGYDLENQLISMTKGSTHLTFKYDYAGRRAEKVVYSGWNGTTGTVESTLRYVYDGWKLMAEQTQSGTVLRTYLWGQGGLLQIHDQAAGKKYLTAADGNGNIVALIDSADGSVDAAYEYGPFGNTIRITGEAIAHDNPFRFSSEYHDEETGLVYYGMRYYSSEMGRFINRDPIDEAGGLNLYGFVRNNPINARDFLGLYEYDPDGEGEPHNFHKVMFPDGTIGIDLGEIVLGAPPRRPCRCTGGENPSAGIETGTGIGVSNPNSGSVSDIGEGVGVGGISLGNKGAGVGSSGPVTIRGENGKRYVDSALWEKFYGESKIDRFNKNWNEMFGNDAVHRYGSDAHLMNTYYMFLGATSDGKGNWQYNFDRPSGRMPSAREVVGDHYDHDHMGRDLSPGYDGSPVKTSKPTQKTNNSAYGKALKHFLKGPENTWLRLLWRIQNPVNELLDFVFTPNTYTVGLVADAVGIFGGELSGGLYISLDLFGEDKFDIGKYKSGAISFGYDHGLSLQWGAYDTFDISGRSIAYNGSFLTMTGSVVTNRSGNVMGRTGGFVFSYLPGGGYVNVYQGTRQTSFLNKKK